MELQIKLGFTSEAANKRCSDNAKILFGSRSDTVLSRLKELQKSKELVLPNVSKLLAILEKAKKEEIEKISQHKSCKKMVTDVHRLYRAKTINTLLKTHRELSIPKALCDIYEAFPQWGMEKTAKYSPNVDQSYVHGDTAKKLEYVKESKPHFTQHVKDALMRNRPDLELKLVEEKIKDTANDGKMVPVTTYKVFKGKKSVVVGRWQRGGRGWHYDRLPATVSNIPKNVAHNIKQ